MKLLLMPCLLPILLSSPTAVFMLPSSRTIMIRSNNRQVSFLECNMFRILTNYQNLEILFFYLRRLNCIALLLVCIVLYRVTLVQDPVLAIRPLARRLKPGVALRLLCKGLFYGRAMTCMYFGCHWCSLL